MRADYVDLTINVLAVVIIVEFAASVASTVYIAHIYQRGERRSRIFRMLIRADIVKVVSGAWIGGLAVFRLVQFPAPLPIWTTPISALVVMLLMAPPIYHALTFRSLRRHHGDHTPPPWNPDD